MYAIRSYYGLGFTLTADPQAELEFAISGYIPAVLCVSLVYLVIAYLGIRITSYNVCYTKLLRVVEIVVVDVELVAVELVGAVALLTGLPCRAESVHRGLDRTRHGIECNGK